MAQYSFEILADVDTAHQAELAVSISRFGHMTGAYEHVPADGHRYRKVFFEARDMSFAVGAVQGALQGEYVGAVNYPKFVRT